MNVQHRCKRRPLETVEVLALECIVLCETETVVRRVIAGSLLFALYARARWSELSAVCSLSTDVLDKS
eukprot:6470321-Amphidinium_carterae.1